MGLDMNAYAVLPTDLRDADAVTDIELTESDDASSIEIAYWRKHGALHNWMNQLYDVKGGTDPDFNMNSVVLTLEDLDRLEEQVTEGTLEHKSGFFFGDDSSSEYQKDDLAFIESAREYIEEGYIVYYSSWW